MTRASDNTRAGSARRLRAAWFPLGIFLVLTRVAGVAMAAAATDEVLARWRAERKQIDREAESDVPAAYEHALRWEQRAPATLPTPDRVRMLLALADFEQDLGFRNKMEQRIAAAERLATESPDEVSLGLVALRRAQREGASGEVFTALATAERAQEHFERSRQPEAIGIGLTQLSSYQDDAGKTSEAVEGLHRAEEIAFGLNDERLLAAINLQYAWAYHHAGRFSEGKRYGQKAVEDARRAGAKSAEARALQVLAASTGRGGDRPAAEKLFRRSVELFREIREPVNLCGALHNLSLNLRNQGKYAEMLPLLEEALALDRTGWRFERAKLLGLRADAQLNLGHPREALADAELSYATAKQTESWSEIADAAGTLKEVLAATGDYRRAYEMAQVESEATEKRGRERIDLRVAELEKTYAAERKQREIDRLEASNRQQAADLREREARERRFSTLALSGVGVAAIIGLLFVRERRARSRALALNCALGAAKDELEQMTRLQSTVIDGTSYGIVVVGADDRLIRIFNAGAERILGYRRDEMVLQQRPAIVYDMEQIAARAAEFERESGVKLVNPVDVVVARVQQGRSDEREWRFRRKDGQFVPILLSITATRAPDGRITSYVAFLTDLTERKLAETALRESEVRFRQAFENAGIGITITDMEHRLVSVNRAFVEMVGFEREALLGRSILEISHPDDVAVSRDEAARLINHEISRGCVEKRYLRGDGKIVWVRSTFTLMEDAAGAPLHFIAQIEDITAHKEAEAALRDANERLRLTFDYAGIGMCMIGLNGEMLRVNRRLCEILGTTEAVLLGLKVEEIVHPEDDESDRTDARILMSGAEPFVQRDLRLRRPDGSEIWVRRTMAILRDAAKTPICIAAQIEDITDHRQYETEIRTARDRAVELARIKSQFLANMSHEIRTPMNGIVGLADILGSTRLDVEQRDMVRLIQGSADSLLTIINDILDFSKIEAGRLELESLPFGLDELISDTVALFRPVAREKKLSFECLIAPECRLAAFGDPVRVRQVLSNLVGNAIKFTPRGVVSVWAQMIGGTPQRLRVEVVDTGIGIPADRQSALFEPFTQAEQGHTRKFGGTGLGLAITRQLITLMRGEIGFSSESGRGSTFWFELPIDRTATLPAAAATRSKGVTASPSGEPLRILVAEDNATNRLVLGHLLTSSPHTVDFAENGAIARTMLAERRYDLVLMDCQMPEIDGFELTRQIRAGAVARVDPRIPIVALTAYAMTGDRERCTAAGMNDYLAKPVKSGALLEMLARFSGCAAAPAPAAASEIEPVDSAVDEICDRTHLERLLRMLQADGTPLLHAALAILYAETPARLKNIAQSVETREHRRVAEIAHQLTGSAANIGAFALRKAARNLEDVAAAADWAAIPSMQTELRREWERLDRFLRAEKFRKEESL